MSRAAVALLTSLLVALAAAGATVASSEATRGPFVARANAATFADTTGDAGGGPDIARVEVSNDDIGTVSFAVTFANRLELAGTDLFSLDLDTDRDRATGERPAGWDHSIQVQGGGPLLFRHGSSGAWAEVQAKTLSATWVGTTLTITIAARELGLTRGFRFQAYVDVAPADELAPFDLAPDAIDPWQYDVLIPAPALAITSIEAAPKPAVPGRPMTTRAVVSVTRSGTEDVLPPTTTVAWRAKVGSVQLIPVATNVAGSVLTASWKLPAKVKGKAVEFRLTVTAEGVTATKTLVHPVRAASKRRATGRALVSAERVKPVFKLMLLTPAQDATIAQNVPSPGCNPRPTSGHGYVIDFAWRVNQRIGGYRLLVQRRGAAIALVDAQVGVDTYTYRACAGFVAAHNLDAWEWRLEAFDGQGVRTFRQRQFTFAPCVLSDGSPCRSEG